MPTSSANPDKLQRYSHDGLELVATLRSKSTAVTGAMAVLRPSSGTTYVPSLGAADGSLKDLVGDWHHLDEFAGDVARGFRLAGSDPDGDGVYRAPDAQIAQHGRVGYANGDQAIAAATALANEVKRLIDSGASPAEVRALTARLARGQYDPAFAVTLSEQLGVKGYVDGVGTIRLAYGENNLVPPEGLDAVKALSTTLTTALGTHGTHPNAPGGEYLPDGGLHISSGFVSDLTGDFDPEAFEGEGRGPTAKYNGPDAATDLSVLLRYADPPPHVAEEIAMNRLVPRVGEAVRRDATFRSQLESAVEGAVRNVGNLSAAPEPSPPPTITRQGISVTSAGLPILLSALAADDPPLASDNYIMAAGAYRGWGEDNGGVITNYARMAK